MKADFSRSFPFSSNYSFYCTLSLIIFIMRYFTLQVFYSYNYDSFMQTKNLCPQYKQMILLVFNYGASDGTVV